MRKLHMIPLATAMIAYAASKDAGNTTKGDTKGESTSGVEILGITNAVPIPQRTSNRGSTSAYPLDQLDVGQSVGVKGKTAKQLAGIVNNANRKHRADKVDEAGNKVYATKKLTASDGTVTEIPDTSKALKDQLRKFAAFDVNPAEDPQGATARIFRVA